MRWAVNFDASQLVDRVGALLWPPRCLLCGDAGDDGRDLCSGCAATLPWNRHACACCALPLPRPGDAIWLLDDASAHADLRCGACLRKPPPLAYVRAVFTYGFPVDRLLPRLKFHHGLAAGRLLGQLGVEVFASAPRPEAVVPIPLHRNRLRRRGYDQALELARPLARGLGLPLREDLLRRGKPTAPQSRLDAGARRRNLKGAFDVRIAGAAMPSHVAVFDDVMTTGATVHAAARALRKAGVARVDAWICARVP